MLQYYLMLLETEEDQELFEELYQSHIQKMCYVARSVTHNSELAEDAVQDVFEALIEHMDSIRGRCPQDQKNYLLKAAQNRAINIVRKEHTQDVYYVNYLEEVTDGVLEELCRKLDRETVLDAIARLREPYNTVLYCRYVMQLDEKETAALLKKKPDAVRQQVSRGRKLLKIMMEEASYVRV